MRPKEIAIAVGGLVVVSLILLALPIGRDDQATSAPVSAAPAQIALEQQPLPTAGVRERTGSEYQGSAGSDAVIQPSGREDTLDRVASRASSVPPAEPQPAASAGALRERLLYRPLALGAGEFVAQNYRVILAGLEATAKDEMCGSGLDEWSCGLHARTAFRNWLRGRAITCAVPPTPPATAITARCQLAEQDPAEWLVSQGWARALANGPYAALGARAQAQERGLFGPAPVATLPVTSTAPETTGG